VAVVAAQGAAGRRNGLLFRRGRPYFRANLRLSLRIWDPAARGERHGDYADPGSGRTGSSRFRPGSSPQLIGDNQLVDLDSRGQEPSVPRRSPCRTAVMAGNANQINGAGEDLRAVHRRNRAMKGVYPGGRDRRVAVMRLLLHPGRGLVRHQRPVRVR